MTLDDDSSINNIFTVIVGVVGHHPVMMGIHPINIDSNEILLRTFNTECIKKDNSFEISTSECTCFEIQIKTQEDLHLDDTHHLEKLFDNTLSYINHYILTYKVSDLTQKTTPFNRQIGRVDVKMILFCLNGEEKVAWLNPIFKINKFAQNMMSGLFPNMIVNNSFTLNSVNPITKRMLSSFDLLNLGFYTESFISAFSLLEDLIRELTTTILNNQNITSSQKKKFFEGFRSGFLKNSVTVMTKISGWESLSETDQQLYSDFCNLINTRNNILHNNIQIGRNKAIIYLGVVIRVIDWLRKNNYGYDIPNFPLLAPINIEYFKIQDEIEKDKKS